MKANWKMMESECVLGTTSGHCLQAELLHRPVRHGNVAIGQSGLKLRRHAGDYFTPDAFSKVMSVAA
jgi:hypothetical protein